MKARINGSGSSKMILRQLSVIARCVWLEGVSTPTSFSPCGASIDMDELTCSHVAAGSLRLHFRLYLAVLGIVLRGWESTFLRLPACPS
jgi:hypothetical protein